MAEPRAAGNGATGDAISLDRLGSVVRAAEVCAQLLRESARMVVPCVAGWIRPVRHAWYSISNPADCEPFIVRFMRFMKETYVRVADV